MSTYIKIVICSNVAFFLDLNHNVDFNKIKNWKKKRNIHLYPNPSKYEPNNHFLFVTDYLKISRGYSKTDEFNKIRYQLKKYCG